MKAMCTAGIFYKRHAYQWYVIPECNNINHVTPALNQVQHRGTKHIQAREIMGKPVITEW